MPHSSHIIMLKGEPILAKPHKIGQNQKGQEQTRKHKNISIHIPTHLIDIFVHFFNLILIIYIL
jgi:hypothetical protein